MNIKTTALMLAAAIGMGAFYYFYEVEGSVKREAAKSAEKKVFPSYSRESPREIGIRTSAQDELYLSKDEQGWFIERPVRSMVDPNQMNSLVDALVHLKREEIVVESGADLREFGLNTPLGTVAIKPISGAARTIFLGIDNPTGMFTYAMVDGEPAVFMISRGTKTSLMKNLDQLRDKVMLRFDEALVKSLRVTLKRGPYRVAKDSPENWSLTSPEKAEADPQKISDILDQLARLSAQSFAAESDQDANSFGLSASSEKIELTMEDGQKLTLQIGKITADGSGFFARRLGVPKVVVLPKSAVEDLAMTADDFKLEAQTPGGNPEEEE